jgi:glycosyltransferase involved in cell wall biosynthesis
MPQVSVILPCFNAAGTLEDTLESLTRQTMIDFEIIAVDDGSTDATQGILNAWTKKDNRIQVYKQPHSGVINASNLAISKCKAQYIARMDADDLAYPERLEKQTAYLENHPNTAAVGSLVNPFSDSGIGEGYIVYVRWLNSLVTNEEIRREIFIESPIVNPSLMIRKSWLLKMNGYQDYGWPEDYDLLLRLFTAGAVFGKVPEVLLDWRDHPKRITRTDSRYAVTNFLKAKAHYLALNPLVDKDAVIIWGAGMMGRRLGKHLQDLNLPLRAYIDIDPKKIGNTRRGQPILAPEDLAEEWGKYNHPVILAAVGARDARGLIRKRLSDFGFIEGIDWWGTA